MSTLVFNFGRFSPPTMGHAKVIKVIQLIADRLNGDARVYLSHSHDATDNPIPYDQKLDFMRTAFGDIVQDSEHKTVIKLLASLSGQYDNVVMVVGEDRVNDFSKMLTDYNGKAYDFKQIKVVSAGDRNDDADGIEGVSASKMRDLARSDDLEGFTAGLPKGLRPRAKEVFDAVNGTVTEDYQNKELNIHFHDNLNSKLFKKNRLDPVVRNRLLIIASDFKKHINVPLDGLVDITISGSNAAYSYTDKSDIDLHLIVKMPEGATEVYRELFDSKKFQYNSVHNYKIRGYDVELYVQDAEQEHISQGIYSVMFNEWVKHPEKVEYGVDEMSTKSKYNMIKNLIEMAGKSSDLKLAEKLRDIIKKYRKAGLESTGEFGPENLAFKALRANGYLEELYNLINSLQDNELSMEQLDEANMSPGALADFSKSPVAKGMTFGFEAEVIVPGLFDLNMPKDPDFSKNASFAKCKTIDDLTKAVTSFFGNDSDMDTKMILMSVQDDFQEYALEEFEYSVDEDELDALIPANADREEAVRKIFKQFIIDENVMVGFLQYNEILDALSWHKKFGLEWPHKTANNANMMSPDDFAKKLGEVVGMGVNVGTEYHIGIREPDKWVIEPDISIAPGEEYQQDHGAIEVISPPMPFEVGIEKFQKFFEWANKEKFKTNHSTGFHVGLSVPKQKDIDELKLIIMLGDQHVLREFGRTSNSYAKSSLDRIKEVMATRNPAKIEEVLELVKTNLQGSAKYALRSTVMPAHDKHVTVNNKGKYIEFRSAGGDYVGNISKLTDTINRYVRAMASAADPEMDKQEYLKKLYKLITTSVPDPSKFDAVRLFALHAAGRIPGSKLAKMLKTNRPDSDKWQIINKRTKGVSAEFTAKTRAEAVKYMQKYANPRGQQWADAHELVNVKG